MNPKMHMAARMGFCTDGEGFPAYIAAQAKIRKELLIM
jgi:hypothetical protein